MNNTKKENRTITKRSLAIALILLLITGVVAVSMFGTRLQVETITSRVIPWISSGDNEVGSGEPEPANLVRIVVDDSESGYVNEDGKHFTIDSFEDIVYEDFFNPDNGERRNYIQTASFRIINDNDFPVKLVIDNDTLMVTDNDLPYQVQFRRGSVWLTVNSHDRTVNQIIDDKVNAAQFRINAKSWSTFSVRLLIYDSILDWESFDGKDLDIGISLDLDVIRTE